MKKIFDWGRRYDANGAEMLRRRKSIPRANPQIEFGFVSSLESRRYTYEWQALKDSVALDENKDVS